VDYNGVMSRKFIDLTGQQFGRLLPFQYEKGGKWWCICTHGEEDSSKWTLVESLMDAKNLKNGKSQSGGCLQKDVINNRHQINREKEIGKTYPGGTILNAWSDKKENQSATRVLVECHCEKIYECCLNALKRGQQSCGHINDFEKGEAQLNSLLYRYKIKAYKRNYTFALTKEQFHDLVIQNCIYSGTQPREIQYDKKHNGAFRGNGLDRRDNSLGYSVDNAVPCCTICNSLKHTLSVGDWEAKLQRICKMDYNNLFFDYDFEEVSEDLLILQRYNFKQQKITSKNSINTLTEQEYYHLATSDCFYCRAKPENFTKVGSKDFYQGLDQIVHDGGYIYLNCVPCCKACNTAKSNHPQEFFIQHLIKLQKYQRNLKEVT